MKIDEQEFRGFIANLGIYLINSEYISHGATIDQGTFYIVENKLIDQHNKYIEMLSTPKPSRWKQLKIDL